MRSALLVTSCNTRTAGSGVFYCVRITRTNGTSESREFESGNCRSLLRDRAVGGRGRVGDVA
jgi:hypothetical protein